LGVFSFSDKFDHIGKQIYSSSPENNISILHATHIAYHALEYLTIDFQLLSSNPSEQFDQTQLELLSGSLFSQLSSQSIGAVQWKEVVEEAPHKIEVIQNPLLKFHPISQNIHQEVEIWILFQIVFPFLQMVK
jgi:hypothetical protein